jgi:hydrogenase maturation protease
VATPRDWNEEAPLVVLGMGNLIYSDDGAGLEALNRLGRHPRLPEGVELIDGSLGGLEAAARISRTSRLLIFDAVDVAANPGTVIRMTGDELAGLPGGAVVHRLGVPDLLSVLRLAGWMPSQVLLLGVQPESVRLGTGLSPAVDAGVERMVAAGVDQLARWARELEGPGTEKA